MRLKLRLSTNLRRKGLNYPNLRHKGLSYPNMRLKEPEPRKEELTAPFSLTEPMGKQFE